MPTEPKDTKQDIHPAIARLASAVSLSGLQPSPTFPPRNPKTCPYHEIATRMTGDILDTIRALNLVTPMEPCEVKAIIVAALLDAWEAGRAEGNRSWELSCETCVHAGGDVEACGTCSKDLSRLCL